MYKKILLSIALVFISSIAPLAAMESHPDDLPLPSQSEIEINAHHFIEDLIALNPKIAEAINSRRAPLLKQLMKGKADLSSLGIEKLPDSIGTLVNLTKLKLSSNKLLTLPDLIGNLVNLEELYLANTGLTTLPNSIGNLIKLRKLELSGNSLTGLPDSIGNLEYLTKLNLSSNQITSLPHTILKLQGLQIIDLKDCPLLPDSESTLPLGRKELIKRFGERVQLNVLPKWEAKLSCSQQELSYRNIQKCNIIKKVLSSPPKSSETSIDPETRKREQLQSIRANLEAAGFAEWEIKEALKKTR